MVPLLSLRNESKSCSVMSDSLRPPMDCSLPGFSVHGILQARILEWVAIPFSRDQTQVSYITGRFLTVGAAREVPDGHLLTPSYWQLEIWLHHRNAGGHKPPVDKITHPLVCYVSSKTTIQGFPCLWSPLLPHGRSHQFFLFSQPRRQQFLIGWRKGNTKARGQTGKWNYIRKKPCW